MQETRVWSLGWEDPLEKEMATHSSILAWRIPWTEEPGGLQSMGSQRVGHNWATSLTHSLTSRQPASIPTSWEILRQSGEEKVKVAQSCPTLCDPMDYTVHGVLQARILWGAFPFSRGSSQPRDRTHVSRIVGGFFTSWATREAPRDERQLEFGWSASLTSPSPHVVPEPQLSELLKCWWDSCPPAVSSSLLLGSPYQWLLDKGQFR